MISQIKPAELKQKLDAGQPVTLVDVRNYDEFAHCRLTDLADGLLIPLGELASRIDEVDVPKDTFVVVYCHHGVRSLRGAAILMAAGFENVASLSGGIEAWSVQIDPTVARY